MIWVNETKLTKPSGQPIPSSQVGLRPDNRLVISSLPENLQAKIESFKGWFDQNDDYRHALAHRVPPYIPPYAVKQKDQAKEAELERKIWKAVIDGDSATAASLRRKRQRLRFFSPVIQHSWGEEATPILFHAMLVADSRTVADLTNSIFDSLDAMPATN